MVRRIVSLGSLLILRNKKNIQNWKKQVMSGYSSQNGDEENYMGYIDVYKGEDQIMIYLDLGGVSEENCNMAVTGILKALNSVAGIKSVIINEEM